MKNNIVFSNSKLNIENYDSKNHVLVIENKKDEVYHLSFEDYCPSNLSIKIINSKVTIIENYKGNIDECNFTIDIDENSDLTRFSILVENTSNNKVLRTVNNNGRYQSMQIDLNECDIDSTENINLLKDESYASVIDGIYAINKSSKKYQTNLNHYQGNCESKAQIFAINNDKAHVSIFTDAYIKNGAIRTKTNQEGRIINLSDTCSGIVLPNLHIDENDVEASHSCSVGSLNQEHMYYLESRGLSELQSRNILIRGYFNPLLENVLDENIKEEINKVLDQRIG